MRGEYRWLTVEEVSQPRGGMVSVIRDHWWLTNADGKVAMYLTRTGGEEHPQCNASLAVIEYRVQREPGTFDGEPVQIPLAFSNHRCEL